LKWLEKMMQLKKGMLKLNEFGHNPNPFVVNPYAKIRREISGKEFIVFGLVKTIPTLFKESK